MFKVSLATYSGRLRHDATGELVKLAKFGKAETDLLDVLQAALESMKAKRAHDAESQHVMNTRTVIRTDDRTLTGFIESGIYGRGSRLRHVESWTVTHNKTAKEADMLPFYFLIHIPEMADEGILILERAGNAGIRKTLGASLGGFVSKTHPGYTLSIYHLVRDDVVAAYLDGGEVSAIRLIRFGLPNDFADMLAHGHKEEEGSLELVARMGRGRHFSLGKRIQRFIGGKVELQRFVELKEFRYDTVKLDVLKDGETRTVDLNRLRMRGFYNISGFVKRDDNGNPAFESIDKEARNLLQKIRSGMYAPEEGG